VRQSPHVERANLAALLRQFSLFWVVALLILPGASAKGRPAADSVVTSREADVKAFLAEELEFDRYLFPPGPFPSVRWNNPRAVEEEVGKFPLAVEYYDASFVRVSKADHTGRYGAVVRGTTKDGFSIARYVTLYCCTADLDDYSPNVPLSVNPLPGFGIAQPQWESYLKNLRRFSFGSLLTSPGHDPDAAVFLAGLAGLNASAGRMETPRVRDRQWWTEFKRKNDGRAHPSVNLSVLTSDAPAPLLADSGTVSSPAYQPSDLRRLNDICSSWTDSARVPLVALVVHDGKIVFHQAYGAKADGAPMTLTKPTWMASITKLLTGVLVMQFVDRGLLDLDAPLDRYIPEFASAKQCPLTLRHLLTHTSGLSWVGEWASDWNPSLENEIAQALPFVTPGISFKYHRVGYALAGKVLERVSGYAVPYLFENLLMGPLGMRNSFADNTYGGLYATAADLARFGQMLLGHGRYGEHQYLSERAWSALLPKPLQYGQKDLRRSWGIGSAPLGGNGLSDSTFGHEAASGALFRIDPVHKLVVVLGRDSIGPDYKQYERFVSRFLHAVGAPWEKKGVRE
jgi:CubicO group peptidase (beta-lactamase class C family)